MDSPALGNRLVSADCRAWHLQFNEALASRDLERYLGFLHDDCSLQINNEMPVYSKRAIKSSYAQYLTSFQALSYEIMNILGDDRKSVCELLYTYSCNDGSTEVVQTAYMVDRNEAGLLTSVRVYGNGARVFKPFMRAND